MFVLYTALYVLSLCALAPRALWHLLSGGRYGIALVERLGRVPPCLQGRSGAIWIHAVSVGEVHAARGLIPHLRECFQGAPVVISTTTPTGQALAAVSGADAAFYMPLDLPAALSPYFDRLRPRAVLLIETEIWPNVVRECARRGIPIALVNGRLSERSAGRYQLLSRLWPAPLQGLRLVCARTNSEAARFILLGVDRARVFTTGNLKADAAALQPPEQQRLALAADLGVDEREEIVVAGCTMPDEEQKVLLAFRRIREQRPGTRLLVAPRHPERFDEVAALIQNAGFSCQRRTHGDAGQERADVLLLDTIGELPAAYGLGLVAFVGGSLVPTGGHNLLEPAVQGRPVIYGPYMDNFTMMAADFEDGGGGIRVADAEELAVAVLQLLDNRERRQRVGKKARQVARRDAAAGARTARVLAEHLWD